MPEESNGREEPRNGEQELGRPVSYDPELMKQDEMYIRTQVRPEKRSEVLVNIDQEYQVRFHSYERTKKLLQGGKGKMREGSYRLAEITAKLALENTLRLLHMRDVLTDLIEEEKRQKRSEGNTSRA